MEKEKASLLTRCILNVGYTINEALRRLDPHGITDDDLLHMHRNLADVLVYDWFGILVTNVPNDLELFGARRVMLFRAYFYGCDPLYVAEALAKGEHPIRYCFRFKKGLAQL